MKQLIFPVGAMGNSLLDRKPFHTVEIIYGADFIVEF